MTLLDRHGRAPGVLRLSLTARCNLACRYCCPDSHEPSGLLTDSQRLMLVREAAALGWRQLRLTGGEPLLHGSLTALIARIRRQTCVAEVALTSNGVLLTRSLAQALRQAGLDRLTLSLDGADPAAVRRIGAGDSFPAVLRALGHAREAGLPVKLNAVIARHLNDNQVVPLAALARREGVELRLIEYMDVGNRNGWQHQQVVTAAEMIRRIGQHWPLEPLGRPAAGTAQRWRYRDGGGLVATVASISKPFCADCNRLRITADGVAYTCLFAAMGTPLRHLLEQTDSQPLRQALTDLWRQRQDRYSEERGMDTAKTRQSHAEMAYLGG
ncbi:MAG: GTP 3',8-cyclase MoaA [Aphanocapsa feldmannii 277cV]|uniref:GTP 3',8-cyclase MoaA n=2 Tax=Aphanocapsa feldmannii TaxID=192050 RepID=A0A524RN47_9CHRO|nr:MAG: GTP 3',8-cyclase MoaA [Aphanocapsa feldmannii 288cV]TGG92225.1 MAG: GTP 3',8-cyclase MoaA [Aphanocapsa feldmannii 277cV]